MKNTVREGIVSEVIAEKHAVRVTFPDRNNLVSAVLPVLTLFTYQNKSYALPKVGERVIVLGASNDFQSGTGYVIGSLYTGDNPPEVADEDIFSIVFNDKTSIFYDTVNKYFEMKFADGTTITHDEYDTEITCKGNLNISVDGRIEITGNKEINIEASADVDINARNIHLN